MSTQLNSEATTKSIAPELPATPLLQKTILDGSESDHDSELSLTTTEVNSLQVQSQRFIQWHATWSTVMIVTILSHTIITIMLNGLNALLPWSHTNKGYVIILLVTITDILPTNILRPTTTILLKLRAT
ncbi:unnamed protein product [Absidia cylindrospora]